MILSKYKYDEKEGLSLTFKSEKAKKTKNPKYFQLVINLDNGTICLGDVKNAYKIKDILKPQVLELLEKAKEPFQVKEIK